MIVHREPPGKSLRDRVPALVLLVCFIGLLAYFAAAPVFGSNLNPAIGFVDWVKRFAGLSIVFVVILAPLLIAAMHQRAMSGPRRHRAPRA